MAKVATNVMIDEEVKADAKARAAKKKITFETYLEEALKEKNEK